jgi:hypothetical protein
LISDVIAVRKKRNIRDNGFKREFCPVGWGLFQNNIAILWQTRGCDVVLILSKVPVVTIAVAARVVQFMLIIANAVIGAKKLVVENEAVATGFEFCLRQQCLAENGFRLSGIGRTQPFMSKRID